MRPDAATNYRVLRILEYGLVVSIILYLGRSILVPFCFALLISFVLYPLCVWLEVRRFRRVTAILFCLGLATMIISIILFLLFDQVVAFAEQWPTIQAGIKGIAGAVGDSLNAYLGVAHETQERWLLKGVDQALSEGFGMIRRAISFSAATAVTAIIIPVYVFLILYYRRLWVSVLERIIPGSTDGGIRNILDKVIKTYYNFIKGMGIVYLVVGILNSFGLLLLGVPQAFFFGFLTSILTFIPYVGIMIGSILPITLAWITHQSIWYPLGVVALFSFVQYLEANVIFPIAVSNRLNVNTLVVLLAIFTGSLLWGVAGMILFVPFIGIVRIIAGQYPSGRVLAAALGTELTLREPAMQHGSEPKPQL